MKSAVMCCNGFSDIDIFKESTKFIDGHTLYKIDHSATVLDGYDWAGVDSDKSLLLADYSGHVIITDAVVKKIEDRD